MLRKISSTLPKTGLFNSLVFLALLFSGCEKHTPISIRLDLEADSPGPFLREIHTAINPGQNNRYTHKQVLGDTLLAGFNPFQRSNQIDFIHLGDPERSFKLEFASDQISTLPNSFYIHNLDSIFLLNGNTKTVMIANSKGEIKSKISLDLTELYQYQILGFLPTKPIWIGNRLVLNVRPIGLLENSKFLREPQFISYEPSTSEFHLFGSMAMIADYLGSAEVSTDFYSPYYEVVDEFMYVMYPFYPYIFKIDLASPTFETEKFILGSSLVESTTVPTSNNIHSDQFQNSSYRSASVTFSDLQFHKGPRLFSVILMHPFESLDENGRLKSWKTRKSSLLILDENLNMLSEFAFDNGSLLLNSTISFSNSLRTAISLENENIKDSLHYYLDFDLIGLLEAGR